MRASAATLALVLVLLLSLAVSARPSGRPRGGASAGGGSRSGGAVSKGAPSGGPKQATNNKAVSSKPPPKKTAGAGGRRGAGADAGGFEFGAVAASRGTGTAGRAQGGSRGFPEEEQFGGGGDGGDSEEEGPDEAEDGGEDFDDAPQRPSAADRRPLAAYVPTKEELAGLNEPDDDGEDDDDDDASGKPVLLSPSLVFPAAQAGRKKEQAFASVTCSDTGYLALGCRRGVIVVTGIEYGNSEMADKCGGAAPEDEGPGEDGDDEEGDDDSDERRKVRLGKRTKPRRPPPPPPPPEEDEEEEDAADNEEGGDEEEGEDEVDDPDGGDDDDEGSTTSASTADFSALRNLAAIPITLKPSCVIGPDERDTIGVRVRAACWGAPTCGAGIRELVPSSPTCRGTHAYLGVTYTCAASPPKRPAGDDVRVATVCPDRRGRFKISLECTSPSLLLSIDRATLGRHPSTAHLCPAAGNTTVPCGTDKNALSSLQAACHRKRACRISGTPSSLLGTHPPAACPAGAPPYLRIWYRCMRSPPPTMPSESIDALVDLEQLAPSLSGRITGASNEAGTINIRGWACMGGSSSPVTVWVQRSAAPDTLLAAGVTSAATQPGFEGEMLRRCRNRDAAAWFSVTLDGQASRKLLAGGKDGRAAFSAFVLDPRLNDLAAVRSGRRAMLKMDGYSGEGSGEVLDITWGLPMGVVEKASVSAGRRRLGRRLYKDVWKKAAQFLSTAIVDPIKQAQSNAAITPPASQSNAITPAGDAEGKTDAITPAPLAAPDQEVARATFFGWGCVKGSPPGDLAAALVSYSSTLGTEPRQIRTIRASLGPADEEVYRSCGGQPGTAASPHLWRFEVQLEEKEYGRFLGIVLLDQDRRRANDVRIGDLVPVPMPEWYGAKLLAPPPRAEPEPAQNAPPKEQDDPDGRPKQPAAECVDEPMDAADLCPAQWKRVVDRVALFNGYVMTKRPPNPTIGPARALFVPIKAGAFPVPDFNPGKMSTASVLVTFSEEEEANAQAGFTDVKVSASYGFASASVGVRKEQKSSSQSSSSSTRAVANFLLQRATVEIDRDRIGFPFRTNPDFIAGVGKIAAAIESDERKYEMYFGMLESWGHVYPKRIVLGGRLTSSFALSTQAASNSRETSSQIKVEVEAKFGNAGGGVSAGRGKSESSSSGSSSFTQSSSWTAYGGKTSLVSGGISASGDTSPFEEWKRSVDQGVGNWAVVAMSNFVPVHQLLPDDLRKAVESWQAKYEATRPPIAAALGFDGWTPMPGWNMRYGGAVKPNDMVKWDGVDGLYNYGKQASEDDCRALCEADQACWAYIWESPQSSAAEWRTYCHGRSAFMWTAENPGMWGLLVQSQDGLFSGYKNYRDDWIRINAGDTKPDGDPYRISYFLGDFWSPSDFGKAQVCRGCKCVKQYLGNMPTYDMCKAACLSRNNNGGQVQCQVMNWYSSAVAALATRIEAMGFTRFGGACFISGCMMRGTGWTDGAYDKSAFAGWPKKFYDK